MRTRVLFLCTEDALQSPAAEAILSAIAGDRFEVKSAGTLPKARFDPRILAALEEHDIAAHTGKPKDLEALNQEIFDYAVTFSEGVREAASSLRAREQMDWSFPLDVGAENLAFRRLVVGLRRRIGLFVTVVEKDRERPT